jgi:dolichol-phosphate mannosyltransferase
MSTESFICLDDGQVNQIASDHHPEVTLSLVIPTFNEAENIPTLIRRLNHLLDENHISHELIVVDDDSPDKTWEIAREMTEEISSLRVIRRVGESGLATAVVCGWAHANGKFLGVIDGDGQHPPELLLDLLAQFDEEVEVAVASRHLPGGGVPNWSSMRRLLSKGAQALGLLLLPGTVGRVTDPMSGYFIVDRKAIADCDLQPVGYKILLEVLARGKVNKVAESPYYFQLRESGSSKVRAIHYLHYLRHLLRLRVDPLRSQALVRYFGVSLMALIIDAAFFFWIFEGVGWNLTRSALLSGEAGIIFTILLLDLWTFAGRPARNFTDRFRRLLGVQIALGVLLVGRLILINALITWTTLEAFTVFLIVLIGTSPTGHLLGSRLTWRPTRR